MVMEKIAVIGTGYVGLVSGTCFAHVGNHVVCCDIDRFKIERLNQVDLPIYEPGLEEMVRENMDQGRLVFTADIPTAIREADIIMIAVGTPMSSSGEADLRYVKEVAKTIGANLISNKIIVTKSTVPLGTGKLIEAIIRENLENHNLSFDVVSNPEFLREGSALFDCFNMERVVIGATNDQAADRIAQLYKPFQAPIIRTNLESSEMIKYASNAFLATKISFINSIANICERLGADITDVVAGMGLDSRIGRKFLQAGIGYGGSCFPKDTQALKHIAQQSGYEFKILDAVIHTNEMQRVLVLEKLEDALSEMKGKEIAILGVSFKPNTNDVREAPSVTLIPALLAKGARIRVYDPVAIEEIKKIFDDRITYHEDLYETLQHCEACVILTEWESIVGMDLAKVRQALKYPNIIDGRNCFETNEMKALKFNYYSIGRAAILANEEESPTSRMNKWSIEPVAN